VTTIVTDVGSVKHPIVQAARKYFVGNFIGGHPMAGIELSGIEAAHPLLFENAVYVLTPSKDTKPGTVRRLGSFFAGLGARSLVMDARVHDQVASAVSHVPQLAAVALMTMAGAHHRTARRYLGLGAGGFRDLTRIASSRFTLWQSILQMNRGEITRSLDLYIAELRAIRKLLSVGKHSQVKARFSRARSLRQSIPRDMRGFLSPLFAVHVFVPDRPGMLARVTALISKHRLNIKDIELMKIREGAGGTFRLSFDSRQSAVRASAVLRKKGFETADETFSR
jgi:prephenate dehydrogenase